MAVRQFQVSPHARGTFPGTRVFFFFGLALLISGGISLLFADLLWRRGWTSGSAILMCLFAPLMLLNTLGAVHGIYGFFLRRIGDAQRITTIKDFAGQDISTSTTAILFPIYNEEAAEVFARLKATYQSLQQTGWLDRFDFHILSDSTEPANWIDEETRWLKLVDQLDGRGRIFYRRRLWNEGKKSGNIRDFLNTFGNRYRYFVVFDADSFMSGPTIVSLVKIMEANPRVGLIQTPPAAINAESLFGRLHQFANRLYSPLFTAGANYWVQGYGNYVGHNAIVRTAPFMQFCDLPKLPGKKSFGGQILSHDFVEAALLLKNNWQVWQAYDLEDSFEEPPPGLIEYAQRDRRWCQGNLQHILVVFARRLRGISRLHFIFGIMGYVNGPLWLLFMLTFNAQVFFQRRTGLSDITAHSWAPFLRLSGATHALMIFALATLVLLIPKILALIDLACEPKRARAFGGVPWAALSALLELLFSTIQAPLLMLWHTEFVIKTFRGAAVNWGKQNRQADGTSWSYALRKHWKHIAVGIVWGIAIWRIEPSLLGWFSPILLAFLLAVPFTVLTSRRSAGQAARRWGLFVTPEESQPSSEVKLLRAALAEAEHEKVMIPEVIFNPDLNSLHVALLEKSNEAPTTKEALKVLANDLPQLDSLRQKAVVEGIDALSGKEKLYLLSDLTSVRWLHREIWAQPTKKLAETWQSLFRTV